MRKQVFSTVTLILSFATFAQAEPINPYALAVNIDRIVGTTIVAKKLESGKVWEAEFQKDGSFTYRDTWTGEETGKGKYVITRRSVCLEFNVDEDFAPTVCRTPMIDGDVVGWYNELGEYSSEIIGVHSLDATPQVTRNANPAVSLFALRRERITNMRSWVGREVRGYDFQRKREWRIWLRTSSNAIIFQYDGEIAQEGIYRFNAEQLLCTEFCEPTSGRCYGIDVVDGEYRWVNRSTGEQRSIILEVL